MYHRLRNGYNLEKFLGFIKTKNIRDIELNADRTLFVLIGIFSILAKSKYDIRKFSEEGYNQWIETIWNMFSNEREYLINFLPYLQVNFAAVGIKDFTNLTISKFDISDLTVDFLNFNNTQLHNPIFCNTVIKNATFQNTVIYNTNCMKLKLSDSIFKKSSFTNANFCESVLISIDFIGVILDGIDFSNSILKIVIL